MELVKGLVAILFLQLTICCNAMQSDSLCEGETCYISPDKFWQFQDIVSSNKHIVLNGIKFSVEGSNGSILIENASNLTISGGGEGGSLIECSPQSTFGLHLKNATNVTLTQITIRYCAGNIFTLLIQASQRIILSGVHIDHSPGFALFMHSSTNESSETPFFFMDNVNPDLTLTNCNISNSELGSVVFGKTSVLIERTVIANSTIGIDSSFQADIMMTNVDITNCTESDLTEGRALVQERLTMNNSFLSIRSQYIHIQSSKTAFYDGGISVYSGVLLTDDSEALFTRSGLELQDSRLQLTNNSTLIVTGNINQTGLSAFASNIYITGGSSLLATNNIFWGGHFQSTTAFDFIYSTVILSEGKLILKENECQNFSYALFVSDTEILMENGSFFYITQNKAYGYSAIVYIQYGVWNISSDSRLSVTENFGLGGIVFAFSLTSTASLKGPVIVANNTVSDNGALNIIGSRVCFHGRLQVVGNKVETGAINVVNSDIFVTDIATFVDNVADYGGAVALFFSVMFLSTKATVEFTRNQAKELGGAIYVSNPRNTYMCDYLNVRLAVCSIQVLPDKSSESCRLFSITFNQNKAGVAGNAIYGDKTSACTPNSGDDFFCYRCTYPNTSEVYQYNGLNTSSDLSDFTSDPTRVCFCENGTPDCYKAVNNVSVHPGEKFHLSLATVGYGLGTVPGSVIAREQGNVSEGHLFGNVLEYVQEIRESECQDVGYSIVSVSGKEEIVLAVDPLSFTRSLENVELVVNFQKTRTHVLGALHTFNSPLAEAFFHIPVFVEVDLLPCPVGFELVEGRCVCHQILQQHSIGTCFFWNGTAVILRPAPFWIGLPSDKNLSIIIHPHCPIHYCQSEDINITTDSPDTQCLYQRSGVLCGSCREGYSMILGSSVCKKCSDLYLLSISLFILMGVALVAIVTLLNMTVSVGTLNGLILFANILQANRTTFLPPTTSNTISFLSAFIAWLNLDIGIPMCFFDGLTAYVKTWLQFVFPLYILALVGAIIAASKYSARVTRLLGTNAVSVLATLVLLSYTKILRILITAFSFTTLTGSEGYHSVVWLADGNIIVFRS